MRYALVAVAGLGLGIVIAKYTLPPRTVTKTEIKTETVEVVKWKDRIVEVQGPTKTTIKTVTVPGPAGPTVTVEKVIEKEKVVTVHDSTGGSTTSIATDEKTSKTVDARSWFALEGMAAVSLEGRWAGAGSAQLRLLGPLWAGVGAIKADTWYYGAAARWEF
jgi:hypothetical protein